MRTTCLTPARFAALIAAALIASAPAAVAQRGERGAAPDERARPPAETSLAQVPDAEGWRALLAEDARVAFTQRTTGLARAVLDMPDTTEQERAIAILALGSAGAVVERARLERLARSGTDLERRAAVLALGEMAAGSDALLEEWMAKAEPPVAECALLALLRSDRAAGRRRVEEIAADPTHRLAKVAADLLVFAVDRQASVPTRAAALLLRLRYAAARDYGLIDGETWQGLTVRKLAQDAEFVREVVLSAAATLRNPAARDHVFAELQKGGGKGRLRAAIALMPGQISNLVDAGLWQPATEDEWAFVLDEIDARRIERLTLPLLRAAMEVPSARHHAIALASLAGEGDPMPLLELDVTRIPVDDRVWVALAVGARTDSGWRERFSMLGEDKSLRVRMAWVVAAFRQGDRRAQRQVEEILADEDLLEHKPLVHALGAAVHDPTAAVVLEQHFSRAPEEEKLFIATTLCLAGRYVGRAQVRAALAAEPPPGGLHAVRYVRALARHATSDDLVVLRRLFPSLAGDRAVDRELALALIEHGEPEVMPILRIALWEGDLDISLLAGGLIASASGVRALAEELRVPPRTATSSDLRRVGFAVGEWGGVAAVTALARDLRWSTGEPALQGALLGALSTRTQ